MYIIYICIYIPTINHWHKYKREREPEETKQPFASMPKKKLLSELKNKTKKNKKKEACWSKFRSCNTGSSSVVSISRKTATWHEKAVHMSQTTKTHYMPQRTNA